MSRISSSRSSTPSTISTARPSSSAATAAISIARRSRWSLKIAAANGVGRVMVGRGGHSLHACRLGSHSRESQASGGIILSASHNPGGPHGDFGIKYDVANGGPAPEKVTEAIFAHTKTIDRILMSDSHDVDIDQLGTSRLDNMEVEVIDPVADYRALMETPVRFRRASAASSRPASACVSTPCMPSPDLTPGRSSRMRSARRPAPWSMASR